MPQANVEKTSRLFRTVLEKTVYATAAQLGKSCNVSDTTAKKTVDVLAASGIVQTKRLAGSGKRVVRYAKLVRTVTWPSEERLQEILMCTQLYLWWKDFMGKPYPHYQLLRERTMFAAELVDRQANILRLLLLPVSHLFSGQEWLKAGRDYAEYRGKYPVPADQQTGIMVITYKMDYLQNMTAFVHDTDIYTVSLRKLALPSGMENPILPYDQLRAKRIEKTQAQASD